MIETRSLVAPGIYRSGQPTPQELVKFANAGGKAVIRLNSDGEITWQQERIAVESAGMKFIPMRFFYIPLPSWLAPSHAQVAGVISILNNATNQPVLIHCYHGEDRTGTVIACYRIDHGMSVKDALAEAKAYHMNWISWPMRWFIRRWKRS